MTVFSHTQIFRLGKNEKIPSKLREGIFLCAFCAFIVRIVDGNSAFLNGFSVVP